MRSLDFSSSSGLLHTPSAGGKIKIKNHSIVEHRGHICPNAQILGVQCERNALDGCSAGQSAAMQAALQKLVPFLQCMNQVIGKGQWFLSQGTLIHALRWGGPVPCTTGEEEDVDIDLFALYDGNASTVNRLASEIQQCLVSKGYVQGEFTWGVHSTIPTYFLLEHNSNLAGEPFWEGYEVHFLTPVGDLLQPTVDSVSRPIFYRHEKNLSIGLPGNHWGYADYIFESWGGHGVPADIVVDARRVVPNKCLYAGVETGCPRDFLAYLNGVSGRKYAPTPVCFPLSCGTADNGCLPGSSTRLRIKQSAELLSARGFASFAPMIAALEKK